MKEDIFGRGKANYSILVTKIIDVNAKSKDDAVDIVKEYLFGELQFGPEDICDIFKVKIKEL